MDHFNLDIGGPDEGSTDPGFESAWWDEGPWLKRDADGIHVITPPGPIDERGNTDHVIGPETARVMAHFLELFAEDQ